MKTRLLALLLAGAVTASLLGVSALAAEAGSPALPEGWVWAGRAALAREYAVPTAFQPLRGAVEERLGHF